MTSNNPLDYLTSQGLTISINNNKLNIKPSYLVTPEMIDYIKQHKDSLKSQLLITSQSVRKLIQLETLTPQQQLWLNQIAHILKVTSDYLLEHQLIDEYDLVELLDKAPAIVANCIKTSPYWLKNS